MDKDLVFKRLLCYGLFSEKLGAIFSSKIFGEWIISNFSSLSIPKDKRYPLLPYKITRNNNSPRYLSIPHPLGFVKNCQEIQKSWEKIEEQIVSVRDYDKKSMVKLKEGNANHRLFSMDSYDQNRNKEEIQVRKQFGKKYLVHADIANCYPSVYTHAIGWALVGKKTAKKNQTNKKVWYNRLDATYRNMQDGETKGLPIGPDSSAIAAELILAQIDKKLYKYDYLRFIDDYKCFCTSKEEADNFIRDLGREAEEFRLFLNTKKTKILPLPQALNEDWVRKLKQFIDWKEISRFNKDKIIGFFDLSNELFQKNPSESPIRYAAKVLIGKKYVDFSSYNLILGYFLNLCFLFPYVLDICDGLMEIGIRRFPGWEKQIKERVQESLEKILIEHVKYNRSDVLTWGLFLAIKYDLTFASFSKLSKKILKTKDCIPALMCYLYQKSKKGNIQDFLDILGKVDEGEWWLFNYEVSRMEGRPISNTEMERFRQARITFLSQEILGSL